MILVCCPEGSAFEPRMGSQRIFRIDFSSGNSIACKSHAMVYDVTALSIKTLSYWQTSHCLWFLQVLYQPGKVLLQLAFPHDMTGKVDLHGFDDFKQLPDMSLVFKYMLTILHRSSMQCKTVFHPITGTQYATFQPFPAKKRVLIESDVNTR